MSQYNTVIELLSLYESSQNKIFVVIFLIFNSQW